MFKSFSLGQFVRDKSIVDISSRNSVLIVEYSRQLKREWSAVSVSRPKLHIGLTISLKPSLNLCSLKWLKFNLERVSSLRPLLWCIAKTEFSIGSLKLRIIYLNQEWHFDKQKMFSTSFKFSKKDTLRNCAHTKQNCVFLAFSSDLSCVSLLFHFHNYMLLIIIFIYIYIYIYIHTYIYISYIYLYIYIIYIYMVITKKSPLSILRKFGILETTFRRLSFSSFILSVQFFHYLQSILSKFIHITLYNFR